jgi:hypothetical protein
MPMRRESGRPRWSSATSSSAQLMQRYNGGDEERVDGRPQQLEQLGFGFLHISIQPLVLGFGSAKKLHP